MIHTGSWLCCFEIQTHPHTYTTLLHLPTTWSLWHTLCAFYSDKFMFNRTITKQINTKCTNCQPTKKKRLPSTKAMVCQNSSHGHILVKDSRSFRIYKRLVITGVFKKKETSTSITHRYFKTIYIFLNMYPQTWGQALH